MIKSTIKTTLPVAIALALSACGSSNNSSTPNTGFVSSGVITGFGSIFVNGVEFETGSATFNVDGVPGTQADLAIGMKVGIEGSINADGVTGTATHVDFDEEIQGPIDISGITTAADGQTKSFAVLGTAVIIDKDDTKFDDDNGIFNFDTIAVGNNVEISGFFDEANTLHATRVELEDAVFDASSIVEVEGIIEGLNGTFFMIGLLEVDASAAALDDLPNGLVAGIEVEVKGTYDAASNTLHATKVEGEDDDLEDSENEIEIEGIVTRYASASDFDVDGHPVDASNAEREPSSLILAEGVHIEVEGEVSNGILIASEVKTREGENEVAAPVSAAPLVAAGTFTLEPVAGQPVITVRITTTTELEDEVSDVDPFSISDIQANDFIKVEGHINAAGELEAKSVHRKNAVDEDVVVEGVITASDTVGATVTVLGVVFPYLDGVTVFEKEGVLPYTSTDFFNEASVINATANISVVDSNADGVADKIELED